METEAFWRTLAAATGSDKPLDVAVVDHLSALPAEEIPAFESRISRLLRKGERYPRSSPENCSTGW
ncbi:DUF4240 domain-containing protein [Streptomyces sp. AC550_RSS872]|uniref:DUF4240 domain-containing protein n=1 Tax=Streptomyces sp. AC550_RSS872 TaxID=2823689 RepID=UPI001C2659BD|nr:DUF4240 domain-containing protein [Streptomyces sp. AC550_RSS872]